MPPYIKLAGDIFELAVSQMLLLLDVEAADLFVPMPDAGDVHDEKAPPLVVLLFVRDTLRLRIDCGCC